MRFTPRFALLLFSGLCAIAGAVEREGSPKMIPEVQEYLQKRIQEFDRISDEHRVQLTKIATFVKERVAAAQPVKLTFICTHNSRRSQMSQVWAAVAASHYSVPGVESFSGGTEVTAFNPRAIAALQRTGLKIEQSQFGTNPRYQVQYLDASSSLNCFSKVYQDPPNPDHDFCAVMTCSSADKNCPFVKGCALRIALPFEDPKVADGTPEEAETYDERCRQICREMLFLFSQAAP